VDTAIVLQMFGQKIRVVRHEYRTFLEKGIDQGKRDELILGDGKFV